MPATMSANVDSNIQHACWLSDHGQSFCAAIRPDNMMAGNRCWLEIHDHGQVRVPNPPLVMINPENIGYFAIHHDLFVQSNGGLDADAVICSDK
jgi:hypothetical protein